MSEPEDDLDVRLRWPDSDATPPATQQTDVRRVGSTGPAVDRRETPTRGADESSESEQVEVEPARVPRLRLRLRSSVIAPATPLAPDEELLVLRREVAFLREQLRALEATDH